MSRRSAPTTVAKPALALFAGSLALFTAACGSSSTPATAPQTSVPSAPDVSAPAAAPTAPAGAVVITDATNGFDITVPKKWAVLEDPSRKDKLQITGQRGEVANSELKTQATSAFAQGAVLIALATDETTFASNVNMLLKPADGLDADDIMKVVPSVKQQLTQLKATHTVATKTTVDGGPAARIDYDFVPAGQTYTIHGRQIYVVRGGKAYVTTVSLLSKTSQSVADLIVASMHFTKS